MKIVARGSETQKQEWIAKNANIAAIEWLDDEEWIDANADVYFDLLFDELNMVKKFFKQNGVVFANAVITEKHFLPANYIRVNAWNGFLENEFLEIVALPENVVAVTEIMKQLKQKFNFVPDIAGMISPRIICMIINEAYFALGEEISTKEEIDTALKLGTNYPFGPFEWSEKIGLKNVYALLKKLNSEGLRYSIAPKLEEEANK